MSPRPRFSLVVMTYERPDALRRCLESIQGLDYRKSGYEVIVVDDGSADGPAVPLAESYPELRLRYRRIPHGGVAAARNAGLALATGELVGFLADDYSLPSDYLTRAEQFFESYPEARVITFNVRSVGPSPARHIQQLYHELVLLQNAGAEPDRHGIIRTDRLPASRAAIFRRDVFAEVGPFDERLTAGEDGELAQRLAARGIPLYFMHDYYIAHFEAKGFRDFLRQRREYAASYYRVTAARQPRPRAPVWTRTRCARVVLGRLAGWLPISARRGKLLRFALLSPGVGLFLLRFYLTLRELERADLARGEREAAETGDPRTESSPAVSAAASQ